MAVSQASQGCARSSWKYTHTGKRVSVGAVCVALLRSVDGEFIAGARNFMEGARSAPTRSRAAKVASGICASMCDQSMNHVGGFAMASWNFCTHRGANAGLVVCYQTKPKENRATCVARCELCIQKRGDCAVYVADYSTTPKFNRQYERSALSQTPLPSRSPNGGFSSPKNSSKNERSAGSTSLLKSKSPTA